MDKQTMSNAEIDDICKRYSESEDISVTVQNLYLENAALRIERDELKRKFQLLGESLSQQAKAIGGGK